MKRISLLELARFAAAWMSPGGARFCIGRHLFLMSALLFAAIQSCWAGGSPTITSFTPTSGPTGTSVTINGANLGSSVRFYGSSFYATIISYTTTQIVAVVTSDAKTGPITVYAGANKSVTSGTSFTVNTVPLATITGFTPTNGTPGASVTITGTGFSTTPANNKVTFNGAVATVNSATATQLVSTVPSGATTGRIGVSVNGSGTAYSSSNFAVKPTITSFTPTSAQGGTSITITGTGFDTATSFDIVTIGGVIVGPITNATSTQITLQLPYSVSASGLICVTVDVTGNEGCSSAAFTVLPPTISGFTPTSAQVGKSVTITGSGFNPGNTEVDFGVSPPAVVTSSTSTQLVATVPDTATTGQIKVSPASGIFVRSSGSFTILPPTISGFTPTSGGVGTSVTITGTGFGSSGGDTVTFNGKVATITSTAPTKLVVTVPSGATSGPIGVKTSGSTVTNSSTNFTLPPPTISSFAPMSGPPGATVTLTGTGFDTNPTNDRVTFSTSNGPAVVTVTSATATQLVVTAPVRTITGVIGLSVNGGTVVQTSSSFTVPTPTLTGFTPNNGPIGTSVTITGSGFSPVPSYNTVIFNGVVATINSGSTTQLVVTVPNGAATGPIGVTVNGPPYVYSSTNFTVPQAAISSFAPTSATVGTEITINGTNLYYGPVPTVGFHGTPAWVTYASASQVKAIVPQGATTGTITITANGQSATSSNNFVVVPPGAGVATVKITAANAEPATVNQAYTVSVQATAVSGTPTGTIQVGSQTSSCYITLPAMTCSLTGEPNVGEVSLQAHYAGDANFAAASAPLFAHITNPATPTEMCGLDPNTVPNDPAGFVPVNQLSGVVYTPGLTQDITGNGNLSITSLSPGDGSSTTDAMVDIAGTFVGPTNTGITVNGVVASTVNGSFLAANVPLSTGANTITVTATTLPGATATTTATINRGGASTSLLTFAIDSSTAASGFSPWTVAFDMAIGSLPSGDSVQSVTIDPTGSGVYTYTGTTLTGLPSRFVYSTPGLYWPTFTVIDTQGNTYVAQRKVLIQDRVAQRNMLCDVYGYLKNRLGAQDATGAANVYQQLVRSQYQTQFASASSNMPSAVQMLGVIANGVLGSGYAEMTLIRDNADQTRSGFPLRMTRGGDGVWRISEM